MSRRAALLLTALALPACFDLQKVNPGDFVIDDFEDGNLIPRSRRFGEWSCDTFTPGTGPEGDATCLVEGMGASSTHALAIPFQLTDPVDGTPESGVVEVITRATSGTVDASSGAAVDFTGFRSFAFDVKVESGTSTLPTGTQLLVELGCSALGTDSYATILLIPSAGLSGGNWWPQDAPLDTPSTQACLQQVDAVRFKIRPGLTDGQSANGTLHIDNISLLK